MGILKDVQCSDSDFCIEFFCAIISFSDIIGFVFSLCDAFRSWKKYSKISEYELTTVEYKIDHNSKTKNCTKNSRNALTHYLLR